MRSQVRALVEKYEAVLEPGSEAELGAEASVF